MYHCSITEAARATYCRRQKQHSLDGAMEMAEIDVLETDTSRYKKPLRQAYRKKFAEKKQHSMGVW